MKKFLMGMMVLGFGAMALAEVKPFMDRMLAEIFSLKPYLVSEESFKDPKNAQKIDESLTKMVEISKKINHEGKIKSTGFSVPSQVLEQQLLETEQVFAKGNKSYALWMLKSTLGVCMSCHTQLPAVSTKFSTLNKSHVLTNPFDEAEFLFVIRNFDEAMPLYAQAIKDYPKNVVTPENLEKALYRQLFYFVRVKRDFKSLVAALEQDQANANLPKHLSNKIKNFVTAAKKMQKESFPSFAVGQDDEVRKYAESALKEELSGKFSFDDPKKELNYLKVSGVLYEYLDRNPETRLKPEILYWLSFCESHYRHKAFYSLPELYLKQCVLEFPKSAVAKKCLTEYQDLVTMAFTGSSGTHIPEDVTKEIKTMQELIMKVGDK